jgi:hypothetical protein
LLNTVLGSLSSGVAVSTSSYESIATVTATGGETQLNFTSIPATYKHLQIRGISRLSAQNYLAMQVNTDSGTNYARHQLSANGSTVSAYGSITPSQIVFIGSSPSAASTFGVLIINLIDYANTATYKTIRSFNGYDTNGAGEVYLTSGLWRSTAAITGISLNANSGTYEAGSTFALYGIKG